MSAAALNKLPEVSGGIESMAPSGTALNKLPEVLPSSTMSIEEVARALGLRVEQLKRKARALNRSNGFPSPLPGGGWVWSRRMFVAWVDANGARSAEADVEAGNDNAGTEALVQEHAAMLRARYGGRA